jgi:hypothetical protein
MQSKTCGRQLLTTINQCILTYALGQLNNFKTVRHLNAGAA